MSPVLEAANKQFEVPGTHIAVKKYLHCGTIKGDGGSRAVVVSLLRVLIWFGGFID